MSWAILSDDFHENGKILSFSHAAFRLFVCSLTYCRAHKTCGKLTKTQAQAIARMQSVPVGKTIAELVSKKGWDELEDGSGYVIHDYTGFYSGDYTAAERMRKYRNRGVTESVTETVTKPSRDRNSDRNVLGRDPLSLPLSLSNTPTPTPPPEPMHVETNGNGGHRKATIGGGEMARIGKGEPGADRAAIVYREKVVQLTKKYGHPLPKEALEELEKLREPEQQDDDQPRKETTLERYKRMKAQAEGQTEKPAEP